MLLQQVFVNLIMNAMDAMAETPPARRRLTIRSAVRAAEVEVSVRDTGTGLPAEIIDTLFTPFVTTKSHGLGIGLTIARKIVEAHGAALLPATIPKAARHSLSRCPAASGTYCARFQEAVRNLYTNFGQLRSDRCRFLSRCQGRALCRLRDNGRDGLRSRYVDRMTPLDLCNR